MPATQHKALLNYGRHRKTGWRLPLRMALLVMLPLALGLLLAVLIYDWWHQRPVRQVHEHLARMRNVVVVSTWETDYGGERPRPLVSELSLHLRDRPDAMIQFDTVDPDAFLNAKHLYLYGLGGRGFHVQVFDHRTGSATDNCIDIGADGEFAHLIPFPLRNVQDVADRYDELVEVVAKWPKHPDRARLEQGRGRGWTYSVKE